MITTDSNGKATLHLYGEIGQGWFGEGLTAKAVSEALSLADVKQGDEINVLIHSPGGDVFEGIAIKAVLDNYITHGTVMGLAASMGSVIAMSCTELEMVEGSEMMLHKPWSYFAGDADEMRKKADHLDQVEASLIGVYTRRLGDPEKIKEMLSDETWLSAEDAVEMGAADRVRKGKAQAMAFAVQQAPKHESKYLIAASADNYASKLQAEVKKLHEKVATLKGDLKTATQEWEYALSERDSISEKLEATSKELEETTADRDEVKAKLDSLENDCARRAALAGIEPPTVSHDDEAGKPTGTKYEQYKSITDKAERRAFYKAHKKEIYATQPKEGN